MLVILFAHVLSYLGMFSETSVDILLQMISVPIGLLYVLLLSIRLTTRISSEGIFVKLFPFHLTFRYYPWKMISKTEVRQYSPIKEFGGWGYRWGFGGTAMNISGNMGLQLELTDGKKLLIGTQRPDDLRAVLNRLNKS